MIDKYRDSKTLRTFALRPKKEFGPSVLFVQASSIDLSVEDTEISL